MLASKKAKLANFMAILLFSFVVLSPLHLKASITVGVYCRGSEARFSYRELITPFLIDHEIEVEKITVADAIAGALSKLDVLVVTEMGLQDENTTPVDFGDLGKRKIKEFVKRGGVYIGLGMGAKLGVKEERQGFLLADVRRVPFTKNKKGIFKVRLNPEFNSAFPELKNQIFVLAYLDGFSAHFIPGSDSSSIFDFESEIVQGINGLSMLTQSKLGEGTIYLTSWKIHKSPGLKWILPRLVRLATDGKIADYSRYVNLNFYNKEFLFTSTLNHQINRLISKLKVAMAASSSREISEVIEAMAELSEGRYTNFLPHIVGRLRNHNKDVRKKAAEIIRKWQYFAAARDLWVAIENEEDFFVLKNMIDAYDELNLGFHGTKKDLRNATESIKVAVYDDHGIGALDNGVALRQTLMIDPLIKAVIIDAADIHRGFLDRVDVVIFPGGSGSGIGSMLGARGMEKVRDFVRNGGGFLGYCAGAYLGTTHYEWSLHLLNVASYDSAHWARGGAIAEARIEKVALEVFPELEGKNSLFQKFWQGPLMVEGEFNISDFEVMLTFISDIHHQAPQAKGATPGKAWLVRSKKESPTRVVLCSGHPEQTPGQRYFTPRLARWLSRKEIIPYEGYMNPFKYKAKLMFDQEWKRQNASYVSILVENQDAEKIELALKELSSNIHRAEWFVPGFLRSDHPRLRKLTAEIIVDLQIFWAKKDIQIASAKETDPSAKKALEEALDYLR